MGETPPFGLAQGFALRLEGARELGLGRDLRRRERGREQPELLDEDAPHDGVVPLEIEGPRPLEQAGRIFVRCAVVEEHHLLDQPRFDSAVVLAQAPSSRFAVEELLVDRLRDQVSELGPVRRAPRLPLEIAAELVHLFGVERDASERRALISRRDAEATREHEEERAQHEEMEGRRAQDRSASHPVVSASGS